MNQQKVQNECTRVHLRGFTHLGLRGHVTQPLAWLAPAAPAEQKEHGQDDAYEGCQRRCRWHAICIRARRRVGRGRIGAAPQIGAAIVCAPVSRYQGKQGQSGSRPLALGPDRAWLARHIASSGFAVVVPFQTLATFDASRAIARLGKLGALLACTSK
eukprot:scaffold2716_cov64-Phaeocystis_antarctica.AAC.9